MFYPPGLTQKRELEHASRVFNSIEINGTHYSLQRPQSFQKWYDQTPDGFLFSIKGSRFITHMKKLRGVETALANFFASGVRCLRETLGPFLWPLPPNLGFDADRLEAFFRYCRATLIRQRIVPNSTTKKSKAALSPSPAKGASFQHCVEVRHPSFMRAAFFELLRRHRVSFVFADTAGKWPCAEDLTADFVYIRLHGAEELYVSDYGEPALDWWASRLRHGVRGEQPSDAKLITPPSHRPPKIKDAFVYFDNDEKVQAPFDAKRLRARLE